MSNFQKNSKDYGAPDITYQLAGVAEQRQLGIPMSLMVMSKMTCGDTKIEAAGEIWGDAHRR